MHKLATFLFAVVVLLTGGASADRPLSPSGRGGTTTGRSSSRGRRTRRRRRAAARRRRGAAADRPAELEEPGQHDLGSTTASRRAPTGPTRRERARCAPSRARWCCSTTRTSRSWSPSRRARPSSATRAPRPATSRATQVAQFYAGLPQHARRAQPRAHPARVLDGGLRRPLRRRADRVRPVQDAGQGPRVRHGVPGAAPAARPATPATATSAPTAAPRGSPTSAPRCRPASTSSSSSSAGQDESSTWQEFGQMKFPTKEDVTDDVRPAGPRPAQLVADPLRRVDVVGGRLVDLAQRGRRLVDPGRELRHGRLRARVQPHPRHRRQLQQPVRRARRAAPTPASGRCSAAAPSTGPAARTAAG